MPNSDQTGCKYNWCQLLVALLENITTETQISETAYLSTDLDNLFSPKLSDASHVVLAQSRTIININFSSSRETRHEHYATGEKYSPAAVISNSLTHGAGPFLKSRQSLI